MSAPALPFHMTCKASAPISTRVRRQLRWAWASATCRTGRRTCRTPRSLVAEPSAVLTWPRYLQRRSPPGSRLAFAPRRTALRTVTSSHSMSAIHSDDFAPTEDRNLHMNEFCLTTHRALVRHTVLALATSLGLSGAAFAQA